MDGSIKQVTQYRTWPEWRRPLRQRCKKNHSPNLNQVKGWFWSQTKYLEKKNPPWGSDGEMDKWLKSDRSMNQTPSPPLENENNPLPRQLQSNEVNINLQ